MSTYVKGSAVPNATKYDLKEKLSDGTYKTLVEDASEINFDLSKLTFEEGDHVLVVVAQANGYADSDPSNEVIYPVGAGGGTGGGTGNVTWADLPVSSKALGVTSAGTGRVSNTATRFSTADNTKPNGILVPAGKTIHLKGLASGTYPLRFDYIYGTKNVANPPDGSTAAIEGLVGTGSNYNSANYFPCNTEGNDTYDLTNTFGGDYYFWFGFAGLNKTENIQTALGTYDIKYYVE